MKPKSVCLVLLLSSSYGWSAQQEPQACQCSVLLASPEVVEASAAPVVSNTPASEVQVVQQKTKPVVAPVQTKATIPAPKPFVIEKVADEPIDYNYSDDERLADKRFSAVYNMPLWVKDVATLCPWQSKSNDQLQGHIRLVHGQFNEGDRLYAQWIKRGTSGMAAEVLSTRDLSELDQQKMTIQFPKERIFTDFCELTMDARGFNGQQYRLELKLSEPGQYRLNIIRRLTSE